MFFFNVSVNKVEKTVHSGEKVPFLREAGVFKRKCQIPTVTFISVPA